LGGINAVDTEHDFEVNDLYVRDVIKDLEKIAPPVLADEGDKIGLHVGDLKTKVSRIMVAVDATPAVVDHAVDAGAELLVCHHPLIYHPLQTITAGDPKSDLIMKLIKGGTSVYVMHTNYDSAQGGINDVLAEMLGVYHTRLLTIRTREKLYKLAVYVPEESVDAVMSAMAEAGAGHIGNYSHCSFRSSGIGTFLPLPGSDPYIGDVGKLEATPEFRLEMIVPEWQLPPVVDAMVLKHPYEEVAYDIIPLDNSPRTYGYGRVGTLERAVKLGEFRKLVEEKLGYRETTMIGDPEKLVEKVALCGGAGGSLIPDAHAAGADVYVTGDIGHHSFLDADALGLAAIDASHYYTEKPGMVVLARELARMYASEAVTIEFVP
jgi:dinuclear metal center YbgI/SA1388 family protein